MTAKEKKFVAARIAGKSITQSYLDAGFTASSRKMAYNKGKALMEKGSIAAALRDHVETMQNRSEIAAESLIDEMRPIIYCSTSDYIRIIDGELSFVQEAINDPIMSKAIKQIRQTQYGVEIVFHDKLRAIETTARMLGVDQPKEDAENQGVTVVINGEAQVWSE